MNKIKYRNFLFSVWILLWILFPVQAQLKWYNPLKADFPVIQNYGFDTKDALLYGRLPKKAQKLVSSSLWNLACQSSGLEIHFYSNSPNIYVQYEVSNPLSFPHMPSTGVTGVDLYCVDNDGVWHYCFGDYQLKDTVTYSYSRFPISPYHDKGYEYRLYLPLYNQLKWMKIGVSDDSDLTFISASQEKPIVLYGTSIAQGACASRPGMAWSSILGRMLDIPLVNLGFSGEGKMEQEVLNLIVEIDARLYILDCLPNMDDLSEKELINLLISGVKQLRKSRKVPILMLEHAGMSNMEMDTLAATRIKQLNQGSKKAYRQLCAEGITDIFYLSREELNLTMDSWVDAVHPNDFGMMQYAKAVEREIRKILKIAKGTSVTTNPVTQRRCTSYEWLDRHEYVLSQVRNKSCKGVILGNSIIHYWGGVPDFSFQNGAKVWDEYIKPKGFVNLGFAWDRIENLLWRIRHGELDGYEAEKIIIMIGINNVDIDSEEDIVEGIRFLLEEVRFHQPKAQIKLVGLLPCKNQEESVKSINKQLNMLAVQNGYFYSDLSNCLLLPNGHINETLFTDGTHPNEDGYASIVKEFIRIE